jgi:hypothetical protein
MDIIFKFGEHIYYGDESSVWLDILLSFLGALLGFGSALGIYYQETKRDNLKEAQSKSEENRNKLIYFKQLVQSVVDTYENQQLPYLKEFIEEQSVSLLELKVIKRVASNNFSRLKNLDSKGIFEAWGEFFSSNTQWIKEYNKINSAVDFLEGSINDMYRIERSNTEKCYENLLEVKAFIDDIPIVLLKYEKHLSKELGNQRFENEYYHFIGSLISKYKEIVEAGLDLEAINDQLLQPMLETYLERYQSTSFPEEVLMNAKRARLKMNDVKCDVDHALTNIKKVETKNSKALIILQEAISKIENLPLKHPMQDNVYTRLTRALGFRGAK